MKTFIENFLKFTDKKLASIVYLGAGSGGEACELVELEFDHFALYEASEKLFNALERKIRRKSKVDLYNQWVLPSEQETAKAFIYNNPRYNGLTENKSFVGSASNVRLISEEEVQGIPFQKVMEKVSYQEGKVNILISSLGALDPSLFAGLPKNALQKFDLIFSTSFESSNGYKEVLEENCFTESLYFDPSLHNITVFKRVNGWLRDKKLFSEQSQKISSELEAIRAENLFFAQQAQNAEEELVKVSAARDGLVGELDELKSLVSRLKGDNIEAQELIKKQAEDCKSDKNWLEDELNKARQTIEVNANALRLANKMNLKLKADLDSQYENYKKIKASESGLTQLVCELYTKLSDASLLYEQVKNNDPKVLGNQK
jgi:hypothetical protein